MKQIIKTFSLILVSLSALLFASSCKDDLKPQEQEVDFSVSCTPPQAQIKREGQMVTTQLLITEQEVECPRPTKYSVSFAYDETVGTLLFLGKSVQSGASIPLASLTNLSLTYQAKELVGNKVKVTVTNDAPKAVSKEATWTVNADDTYSVETSQEGEGELVVRGAKNLQRVPAGTELTVFATPADGWELVALTANDVDILKSKTFEVAGNTTVRATFTKKAPTTYAVTLTKEGEGKVVISGADNLGAVVAGSKLTVTATPADGWELTALTANGADILSSKTFVVYNPTEVRATFTKKAPTTYAVTLTKEGEGKVVISGADNLGAVVAGTKLTVTAEPASGWELKAITANGKNITADKTFVVNEATNVKVVFARIPSCTIILDYNFEEGTVEINGRRPLEPFYDLPSFTFPPKSRVILAVYPKPGYSVSVVKVDGQFLRPTPSSNYYDLSPFLHLPTHITVRVSFKKIVAPTKDEIKIDYQEENNFLINAPAPIVKVSKTISTSARQRTQEWFSPKPSFTSPAQKTLSLRIGFPMSFYHSKLPLTSATIGGQVIMLRPSSRDSNEHLLFLEGSFTVPDHNTTLKVVFTNN